ncbi:MAG TPA: hypothetical protein VG860_06785 [Terriglobia bacterium]|jgi:hypothetical protein|nr:hypothetical protein [Terriglobia bacterium]
MEQHDGRHEKPADTTELRDLLIALGGAAMVLVGAGLMLSHPMVKRYVGSLGLNDLAAGAVPDIERYLKLRAM